MAIDLSNTLFTDRFTSQPLRRKISSAVSRETEQQVQRSLIRFSARRWLRQLHRSSQFWAPVFPTFALNENTYRGNDFFLLQLQIHDTTAPVSQKILPRFQLVACQCLSVAFQFGDSTRLVLDFHQDGSHLTHNLVLASRLTSSVSCKSIEYHCLVASCSLTKAEDHWCYHPRTKIQMYVHWESVGTMNTIRPIGSIFCCFQLDSDMSSAAVWLNQTHSNYKGVIVEPTSINL